MSRKNTRNVLYLRERDGQLWIDGTAAVKVEGYESADTQVIPSMHVVDRERVETHERKVLRRKVAAISIMAAIMIAGCLSIFWYIGIQSTLTQTVQEIGTLSSSYQSLVTANDARLAEITESVDLDTIRDRAMRDLGMCYADEGQVVGYTAEGLDSVTQVQVVSDGR